VGHRLLRNTALNFVGQCFLLILNFATAPYIVHHLGAEMFGIVALVQTTAGFAGFLNLGIGRALMKYVSALHWTGDIDSINKLFQTAWTICMVSGLVTLVAIVIPKDTVGPLLLRGGPELSGVMDYAIYIAAFGLFSSMLLESVSGIPGALNRFDLSNSVNVIMGTIRVLGSVGALYLGFSIKTVLAVNLASNLVTVLVFALVSRSLLPGLSFRPSFHFQSFKRLFHFSLPLLLAALSVLIVTRLDRFILAYYLPLAAVTFYTLPCSLSEKLSMGVSNVTSVVFPFTSELHAKADHGKVLELYVRSTKALNLVTLPFTVILLSLSEPILRYWLGAEYAIQGAVPLVLLGISAYLNAISAVPTVTILGVGRPWIPTVYAMSGSVINIAANILLIPRYGITGAAMGALLPQAIVVPIFAYHVNRVVELPFWKFFSRAFFRPFVCGVIQFAVLIIFRGYITNFMTLALLSTISLCLFGVLCWFTVLGQSERSEVYEIVSKRMSTFKRSPI
jgi:O-antigen/teichoic acid export membrane protein